MPMKLTDDEQHVLRALAGMRSPALKAVVVRVANLSKCPVCRPDDNRPECRPCQTRVDDALHNLCVLDLADDGITELPHNGRAIKHVDYRITGDGLRLVRGASDLQGTIQNWYDALGYILNDRRNPTEEPLALRCRYGWTDEQIAKYAIDRAGYVGKVREKTAYFEQITPALAQACEERGIDSGPLFRATANIPKATDDDIRGAWATVRRLETKLAMPEERDDGAAASPESIQPDDCIPTCVAVKDYAVSYKTLYRHIREKGLRTYRTEGGKGKGHLFSRKELSNHFPRRR